ncbi:hypothetical protein RISK_003182 [Rhodopirellula islandica]|uniref:Uncharacterized protein n=1 Tax=Rhodopirellula islandica TaxID=595434 RepID=A0A0J1EHC5_RHOIS|nr:hypothetical protein RISK_003182 [Rhodopirellula islandica]
MTVSDGNEAVAKVVTALNESNISYMLVGSYSSNVYGVPRATGDADPLMFCNASEMSCSDDFKFFCDRQ